MRRQFGETRSVVGRRHALISADSHEVTPIPGWPGARIVVVISPHMGARFVQFFAGMPEGAAAQAPGEGVERFVFVLEGAVTLTLGGEAHRLEAEDYALVPAGTAHHIEAVSVARLMVLEKMFVPLEGAAHPDLVIGSVGKQPSRPMSEDGLLSVRKLIPVDERFDCEINVMEFQPGGSLAYVETHFVEHGLLMLDGGGVYRLDDDWFPVAAGDVIWMGPYCPQWFGALGATPARYLIYKNWNRDPMAG
ncbi:(S)-ureidoglycine aminohydrolase [Hoeflea sp. EC-HK425]|uniref:(S)-ureidoglycine aminohydrolase n=1 Tax=Hoeflea sp. EC-HK425 TaxID=2038388 RepID=UPI001255A7AB|nr:(S)-ureidoglycine aminohydrolase [Hoeflea sp. EC-HK425]VVT04942.1 (S)-ureidoglycine aminohydrolase [Hoeflea sp. EC-HK425]